MGQLLQRPSVGGGGGATPIGASVHLAAAQGIPSAAFTPISWTGGTAIDFDNGGFFSALTPTFFTIPKAGIYQFSAGLQWTETITNLSYQITFSINGALRRGIGAFSTATVGQDTTNNLAALFLLAAGDAVALNAFQASGIAQNAAGNAAQTITFMSVLGFK